MCIDVPQRGGLGTGPTFGSDLRDWSAAHPAASTAAGFVPGVGQALSVADMADPNASRGKQLLAILGLAPGGRLLGRAGKAIESAVPGNLADDLADLPAFLRRQAGPLPDYVDPNAVPMFLKRQAE